MGLQPPVDKAGGQKALTQRPSLAGREVERLIRSRAELTQALDLGIPNQRFKASLFVSIKSGLTRRKRRFSAK